jgi:hypothetical protein
VTFKERDPIGSKFVIDNSIIEQVNFFNYLGNLISYWNEVDIDNNLNNYLKTTGIKIICEISSSHGGEYDVQSCLLGYTAV